MAYLSAAARIALIPNPSRSAAASKIGRIGFSEFDDYTCPVIDAATDYDGATRSQEQNLPGS